MHLCSRHLRSRLRYRSRIRYGASYRACGMKLRSTVCLESAVVNLASSWVSDSISHHLKSRSSSEQLTCKLCLTCKYTISVLNGIQPLSNHLMTSEAGPHVTSPPAKPHLKVKSKMSKSRHQNPVKFKTSSSHQHSKHQKSVKFMTSTPAGKTPAGKGGKTSAGMTLAGKVPEGCFYLKRVHHIFLINVH